MARRSKAGALRSPALTSCDHSQLNSRGMLTVAVEMQNGWFAGRAEEMIPICASQRQPDAVSCSEQIGGGK